MKQKLIGLSQRYVTALRKHLKRGAQARPCSRRWDWDAKRLPWLDILELARIHERALATLESSLGKDGLNKRAEIFFSEALTPIVETHHADSSLAPATRS